MKQLFKINIVVLILLRCTLVSQSSYPNTPYKLDKNFDTYLVGFSLCANIVAKIKENQNFSSDFWIKYKKRLIILITKIS